MGEVVYFYFRQDGELVKISTRDVDIAEASQLVDQAMGGQSSFATTETSEGQRIRLHAFPLQGATVADEPVAVVIGRSAEDIDQALQRLAIILTVSAVVAMTLAGGGGWFLARRSLKPVEDITRTARKIEESDLGRRIEVGTDDELGRLAFTLNQMIGRLERAFDRQRQFTADASHELRTPLAIIQAESTRALQKEGTATGYQESLEMISEEAGAMRGLIDRLLTLARVDSGTEPTRSGEINLRALVTDLASDAEVLCQEKGLQFKLGQLEDLAVKGDEAKLKVMFLGLL
ncbi:MAG: HAMP domain-containing sensor histidine kinase, partial [Dehalococcoidia bacterium]|nr:HAMP domain-containing sensor histidine kinase [Dehalococcoidia bacterium]